MAPSAAPASASILHADLDAFYASVEQLLDPSLRGRPIAVGGGVVLAASYEAKAFGVQGGMSGRRARELCPELLFVGGHFTEYQRLGDAAIDVLRDLTPLVERISIDEAFADVTGSIHLFGPAAAMAETVRTRVRDELGLPISVGVATTKHLAKVASQVAKPDGLVVVEPGTEQAFLDPLPVRLLWGVGPVTEAKLASAGIATVGRAGHGPARAPAPPPRPGQRRQARLARRQRRPPLHRDRPPGVVGRGPVGARAAAPDRRRPARHLRLPRRPGGDPAAGRRPGRTHRHRASAVPRHA